MADLAKVCASHRAYMFAPSPTRFVDRSPDLNRSDSVELQTAQGELAHLVRLPSA